MIKRLQNNFNVSDSLVSAVKDAMNKGTLKSSTEKMNEVVPLRESVWRHAGLATGAALGTGISTAAIINGLPGAAPFTSLGGGALATHLFKKGLTRDIDNARKKYIKSIRTLGAEHPITKKLQNIHNNLIDHPLHDVNKTGRYYEYGSGADPKWGKYGEKFHNPNP